MDPPPCHLGRTEHDMPDGRRVCQVCGWVDERRRPARLEGSARRARARALAMRDGDRCHYCRIELDDDNRSIDEVIPLSAGGRPVLDNQVLACTACNNSKGSQPYGDFIAGADPAPTQRTSEAAVSLALGRHTAAALLRDPAPALAKARVLVERRLHDDDVPEGAKVWLREWRRLLGGPVDGVVMALTDPGESGYELRQNLPFTGLLTEDERVRAVREARRLYRAATPG